MAKHLHIEDPNRRGPDYGHPTFAQSFQAVWAGIVGDPKPRTTQKKSLSTIVDVLASPANYTVGRLGYGVNGIIIHTMVGTMSGTDSVFQNPLRQASAHYGIQYNGYNDGPIHRYVGEDSIAWHCGRFYPDGSNPLANANTIGIEDADNGAYNSPRPDALYVQVSQLVKEICTRWGIPIDRTHIRKHTEVSVLYTACPDSLDIDRIVAMAAGVYGPIVKPITGDDDDMLYVGPFHAKVVTVSTFTAGTSFKDPAASALALGTIPAGTAVGFTGYKYSTSPVQSPDLGGGVAGPDYVWWLAASGQWVPDAILDTSSMTGAPTAAIPVTETLNTYFTTTTTSDDDSALVTKIDLANALAALPKLPTKGTGTVTVTLS